MIFGGDEYRFSKFYFVVSLITFWLFMQILPAPNVFLFWNLFRAHAHWRALQVTTPSMCLYDLSITVLLWKCLEYIRNALVMPLLCCYTTTYQKCWYGSFCDHQSSTRLKLLLTEGETEAPTAEINEAPNNSSQKLSWVSLSFTSLLIVSKCQIMERTVESIICNIEIIICVLVDIWSFQVYRDRFPQNA